MPKVPKRTIEARKRRLMKLQQSISKRAKQQWVGRELVILAEGESEETPLLWEGRTQFHAPEIDGKVYINDFGDLETLEAGRFYKAEITEAHEYDVVARRWDRCRLLFEMVMDRVDPTDSGLFPWRGQAASWPQVRQRDMGVHKRKAHGLQLRKNRQSSCIAPPAA